MSRKALAIFMLLMSTTAQEHEWLEDYEGSESYGRDGPRKPAPVYKACASGCTCDGSISIVAAYYGLRDVTDLVARQYAQGKRQFIASLQEYKNDGYDQPYIYDTLSITYQQFCKYATRTVPNIELSKHRGFDTQFYHPEVKKPSCPLARPTTCAIDCSQSQIPSATTGDLAALTAINNKLCVINENTGALSTADWHSCEQTAAIQAITQATLGLVNIFTVDAFLHRYLAGVHLIGETGDLTAAGAAAITALNAVLANTTWSHLFDGITQLATPADDLKIDEILQYFFDVFQRIGQAITERKNQLESGYYGYNSYSSSLQAEIESLQHLLLQVAQAANAYFSQLTSDAHDLCTFQVDAQVDSSETCAAAPTKTFTTLAQTKMVYGDGYRVATYGHQHYKEPKWCISMLPDNWNKFVINLPDPINLPGKMGHY